MICCIGYEQAGLLLEINLPGYSFKLQYYDKSGVDVPHLETAVYGILEAGKTIASNNKEEHAHVSIHHTNVYRHSL